jgi:hypothetical protein
MANALQEMAWRYLETLYERSKGGIHPETDAYKLQADLGFSHAEFGSAGDYLVSKDLITWQCAVPNVRITPRGIDSMQNSYAEKETRVLKVIYELSGQNTTKIVGFHETVPAVGMTDREVSGICKGLEERGFIDWPGGDYVTITRAGIQAIDSLGQPPPKSGDTYNLHIGTSHGPIQQGARNTQNIQINVTNNPDFDQAIQSLLQLIGSSSLPVKDEIQEQVVQVNKLALQEPSPGLFEKAKFRLSMIEVGLKGTDLLIKAGPYLAIALEYFRRKYGG